MKNINNKFTFDQKEKAIEIENLYSTPKGSARRLLQDLFLKILHRSFPNQFPIYKKKIRLIMNRTGFIFRFYLAIFILRLKYPLYFRLPSKQLYAVGTIINFLKVLEPLKIDFFLLEGCLLGAIRQESFAGGPKDLDLGIKEEQLQKLLDSFPLLLKAGASTIRIVKSKGKVDNKIKKVQILFPCTLMDIAIYRKKKIENEEMWVGGFYPLELTDSRNVKEQTEGIAFKASDLDNLITIKAYGKEFLAPANSSIYLEKIFGKNWKIPDKKQFFWNENKLK
jgi:phosphorylcholine metabolism protein LicD